MRKSFKLSMTFLSALLFMGCNDSDTSGPLPIVIQDKYDMTSKGLYPESIDYDEQNKRFLIGSFNLGEAYILSPEGKLSHFINDFKLVGVTGVYTDEANNRYIVLSGDAGISEKSGVNGSTAGSVSYVGIYNADSGALIKGVDLKPLVPNAGVFPDDLTVDSAGNIYITDAFSPYLYKITKDYSTSIFATSSLFSAPAGSFGLNGIVYHPSGYLIVTNLYTNKLYKVSISSNPEITEIGGLNQAIKSPDGIELNGNNELLVVENGLGDGNGIVHRIRTTDNWSTATLSGQFLVGKEDFPTSVTTVGNKSSFVISSKLGFLIGGDKSQTDFRLQKVKFQ